MSSSSSRDDRRIIEFGVDEIVTDLTGKPMGPVKALCGPCANNRHGAACERDMCQCECSQQQQQEEELKTDDLDLI